jgi:hypothetical protein
MRVLLNEGSVVFLICDGCVGHDESLFLLGTPRRCHLLDMHTNEQYSLIYECI